MGNKYFRREIKEILMMSVLFNKALKEKDSPKTQHYIISLSHYISLSVYHIQSISHFPSMFYTFLSLYNITCLSFPTPSPFFLHPFQRIIASHFFSSLSVYDVLYIWFWFLRILFLFCDCTSSYDQEEFVSNKETNLYRLFE